MLSEDNSVQAGHRYDNNNNVCVGVCVCEVCARGWGTRQSLTGGTKLLPPTRPRREEREEERVSMQFLSFPQPPKTKNNATLQWATVACYVIAMAPQQAKTKN